MKGTDALTMEIQVGHDPARTFVELKIAETSEEGTRVIHLSREEARRLAALILSQAARLDRPRASWSLPHVHLEHRSA